MIVSLSLSLGPEPGGVGERRRRAAVRRCCCGRGSSSLLVLRVLRMRLPVLMEKK